MADNKEYLIESLDDGNVLISEEVICTIAAAAVLEVDGVDSLVPRIGADVAEILGMKGSAKGIRVSVIEKNVSIDCTVVLGYGYDVVEVANNIQCNVSNAVSSMTGFHVDKVDVNVSGIAVDKKVKN